MLTHAVPAVLISKPANIRRRELREQTLPLHNYYCARTGLASANAASEPGTGRRWEILAPSGTSAARRGDARVNVGARLAAAGVTRVALARVCVARGGRRQIDARGLSRACALEAAIDVGARAVSDRLVPRVTL